MRSGQALRNIMLDPANRRAYDNLDKALADCSAAQQQAKGGQAYSSLFPALTMASNTSAETGAENR